MNQIRLGNYKISFHPPNHSFLIQILYKLKARILTLKFDKFSAASLEGFMVGLYQAIDAI